MGKRVDPVERFWARVDRSPDGCWLWKGGHFNNGYALISIERRPKGAHRFAYELLVGPIPDGLQLDHLCRVRGCVNPKHLEPVTPRTNLLRGATKAAANAAKTHCMHGHEFTAENTVIMKSGSRSCRECGRIRWRSYHPPTGAKIGRAFADECHRGHPLSGDNLYVSPKGKRNCRACLKIRAGR